MSCLSAPELSLLESWGYGPAFVHAPQSLLRDDTGLLHLSPQFSWQRCGVVRANGPTRDKDVSLVQLDLSRACKCLYTGDYLTSMAWRLPLNLLDAWALAHNSLESWDLEHLLHQHALVQERLRELATDREDAPREHQQMSETAHQKVHAALVVAFQGACQALRSLPIQTSVAGFDPQDNRRFLVVLPGARFRYALTSPPVSAVLRIYEEGTLSSRDVMALVLPGCHLDLVAQWAKSVAVSIVSIIVSNKTEPQYVEITQTDSPTVLETCLALWSTTREGTLVDLGQALHAARSLHVHENRRA